MTDVDPSWLLAKLESIGVPDANAVAQAYAKGDTGELVRALILRQIWVWDIDSWRDQPDQLDKLARTASARELELIGEHVMPDAWASLRRLLDSGIDRRDLALAARGIAYVTAFGVLYALNGGTTGSAADELWDLIPDDFPQADATLGPLHELLLSADPTGRNSFPPNDAAAE